MPEYTFEHRKSHKRKTVVLTIAELEQYKSDNPDWQQVIVAFGGFIPGVSAKPDEGFRDILREIKKAHPGSTIDTF